MGSAALTHRACSNVLPLATTFMRRKICQHWRSVFAAQLKKMRRHQRYDAEQTGPR
ncbi:hypothetical protein KCP74_23650 [Salmonella enterica subsp. enterica]|nr:hypothetical protein KCP74_23650 [Salmonella enterica subsp. enterica]